MKDTSYQLIFSDDGLWTKEFGFFPWGEITRMLVSKESLLFAVKEKEYIVTINSLDNVEQLEIVTQRYAKKHAINENWIVDTYKLKSISFSLLRSFFIAVAVLFLFFLVVAVIANR